MNDIILEKLREIPVENRWIPCPVCGQKFKTLWKAKACFDSCCRDLVCEKIGDETVYICDECDAVYDERDEALNCVKSHFIPLSDRAEEYISSQGKEICCKMCEKFYTYECVSKNENGFCLSFQAEKTEYAWIQSIFECNKRIYLTNYQGLN